MSATKRADFKRVVSFIHAVYRGPYEFGRHDRFVETWNMRFRISGMKTRQLSGLGMRIAFAVAFATGCMSAPALLWGQAPSPAPSAAPTTSAPAKQPPAPENAPAQTPKPEITLRAGDKAPPLTPELYLKGDPIKELLAGQIYVVEFWATWCGPCIAAMPHLSELQTEYASRGVTFVGVNIWEDQEYNDATLAKVREFLATKGSVMNYVVAYDGAARTMDTSWMKAAGRTGIPSTFVVDQAGRLAWIGHPSELDPVLDGVVKGTWDTVEGPKVLKAGRDAAIAACKKYAESYEAGEAAWIEATKGRAYLVTRFGDLRYSEMIAGGHYEKAYALGRQMYDRARAAKSSPALMGVVLPMMDPQIKPKVIDRQLALDVASAVAELGDPADPGRSICLFQIHLLLGNIPECEKHKADAKRLIPTDRKESLERWLKQLEADAEKK